MFWRAGARLSTVRCLGCCCGVHCFCFGLLAGGRVATVGACVAASRLGACCFGFSSLAFRPGILHGFVPPQHSLCGWVLDCLGVGTSSCHLVQSYWFCMVTKLDRGHHGGSPFFFLQALSAGYFNLCRPTISHSWAITRLATLHFTCFVHHEAVGPPLA